MSTLQILLIEDDEEDAFFIRKMLSEIPEQSFQVTHVSRFSEGISYLQKNDHVDVVLLDLNLPDTRGLSSHQQLFAAFPHIPVLITSGVNDQEIAIQAVQSGAQDYLIKGEFNSTVLRHAIRYAIERKQVEKKIRQVNEELEKRILERTAELVRANSALQHEIAERQKIEEALRYSQEQFFKAFQTNPSAIAILSRDDYRYIEVNDSFVRLSGYSREELLGKSPIDYGIFIDELEFFQMSSKDNEKGVLRESKLRHRSGQVIEVLHSIEQFDIGQFQYLIHTFIDVTSRNQRERELGGIAAMATALRTAQTYTEVLPIVLDNATQITNAEGAALVMVEKSGSQDLTIDLATGVWEDLNGTRLKSQSGIPQQVVSSRKPLIKNEHQTHVFFPEEQLFQLHSIAAVPLIAQDQLLGVLLVGREPSFNYSELRLISAIGDIAANALYNLELYEETVKQLLQTQALRSIDQAINASLDLRLSLNKVLEQLVGYLNVDAAAFWQFHAGLQELTFIAGLGFRTKAIQRDKLRYGEGYISRALMEQKIIYIPDLRIANPPFLRTSLIHEEKFISYFAIPIIAKGLTLGVLEIFRRNSAIEEPDWYDFLEALATQAAIAFDNATLFANQVRSHYQLSQAYEATLEGWVRALDLRDNETEGHSLRVVDLTLKLARKLDITPEELIHIKRGALLHDIGKIGVPDHILRKPAALTDEEWKIMRMHPIYAFEMLSPIEYLHLAMDIPYCHHERWDGSGYPRGLKEKQIPLSARIFAVVDVWDALTSDRPYRPAWSPQETLDYIIKQSGKHFDPDIVAAFVEMIREEEDLAASYALE